MNNAFEDLYHEKRTKWIDIVDKIPTFYADNLEACKEDSTVQAMINARIAFNEKFFAQKNWQDVLDGNIATYEHSFNGFAQQMVDAWFNGQYFEAGKAFGLIEAYLFGVLPQ